jgi:ribosomal protein S30
MVMVKADNVSLGRVKRQIPKMKMKTAAVAGPKEALGRIRNRMEWKTRLSR